MPFTTALALDGAVESRSSAFLTYLIHDIMSHSLPWHRAVESIMLSSPIIDHIIEDMAHGIGALVSSLASEPHRA